MMAPGEIVVRRHFQHRALSRCWATTVVADDEHGLWLWVGTGSAHRDLGHADGRHMREVPFIEWPDAPKGYDSRPWRGNVLMFHPREGDYSVWLLFTEALDFNGWYVNLERPIVRWRDGDLTGVDTIDYDLDIVVTPDLTWRWKDEDEFAERLAYPRIYWVDDEAAVRAEGERVIKRIEAGDYPFDGTMTEFRPDPSWPVPSVMPSGWDRPRAW
jgi:Protein of unknown function (DUF402)